jgi:hypothetical protein
VRGTGANAVYLDISVDGQSRDPVDKTSPLARAFMGLGPRFQLRPNYFCILQYDQPLALPLWLLRLRTILPAILLAAVFAGLGHISLVKRNQYIGYGMGGLCLITALLSFLNAIFP